VADDELCTIRIVGLPLRLHATSSEHSDELMREFTYLRAQATDPEGEDVPARLLALVDELQQRFGGFSSAPSAAIDEAIAAGEETLDVEYVVPRSVGAACLELDALLDEADRFCAEGTYLLTLVTPPEAIAYRKWFLSEFVRQSDGEPPSPWPGR